LPGNHQDLLVFRYGQFVTTEAGDRNQDAIGVLSGANDAALWKLVARGASRRVAKQLIWGDEDEPEGEHPNQRQQQTNCRRASLGQQSFMADISDEIAAPQDNGLGRSEGEVQTIQAASEPGSD
jgi:hypothetical protein